MKKIILATIMLFNYAMVNAQTNENAEKVFKVEKAKYEAAKKREAEKIEKALLKIGLKSEQSKQILFLIYDTEKQVQEIAENELLPTEKKIEKQNDIEKYSKAKMIEIMGKDIYEKYWVERLKIAKEMDGQYGHGPKG